MGGGEGGVLFTAKPGPSPGVAAAHALPCREDTVSVLAQPPFRGFWKGLHAACARTTLVPFFRF